jgi:predicted Zn-dependent peptidase
LADMYANSAIPEDELEKERTVILEEINRAEDSHSRKVYDAMGEIMFEGHPLSKSNLGPKKNIKKFKQEDFLDIIKNKYVGAATTVVIAGDIKNSEAKKLVQEHLGHLTKGKLEKPLKYKSKQKKANLKVVNRKIDQSHVMLGFKTFSSQHKDAYALGLLNRILGRGFGSRFFEKIREELGLCYSIYSSNSFMYDTGYQYIYVGVGNKMVDKTVTEVLNVLKDVKTNGVTEQELKRAKDLSINYLMMSLETSSDFAEFFGDQELSLEDITKPNEVIKKIKSVTLKDIQRVAQNIYTNDRMNLAILGPHKDASKFKKLLKI